MDEVSIYDRALSAIEIGAVYDAGKAGKCFVPVAPSITTQPTDQMVPAGEMANFTVGVSGTPPFTYQWRKDGTNISGATTPAYTIASVQPADAGVFSVAVSNEVGWAVSSNATLTVGPAPGCTPPVAGLTSWWQAQGNGLDAVGGNTGVLMGTAGYVAGKVGSAFSFDGHQSYVQVADSPSLRFTNEMTLEFWYKDTGCAAGGVYYLISKRAPYPAGANYGINMDLRLNPPALQLFFRDPSYPTYQVSAVPLPVAGVFHHVAGSFKQVSLQQVELTTYVDGQLVKTDTMPGNLSRTVNDTSVLMGTPSNRESFFVGFIDEASIYGRALSAGEVQAIYAAGSAGKCLTPVAPFIISQPQSQTVNAGALATITVLAGGSQPLSYQWSRQGMNIGGATGSSLVLTNVSPSQAGAYSVVVTNVGGAVTSGVAMLTVNLPAALVKVVDTTADAGRTVAVPITLAANGNEGGLAFTLSYNPARLTFTGIEVGAGGSGAALLVNESQVTNGKVGVMLGLPAGQTFKPGTQEIAIASFTAAIVTTTTPTAVTFGDTPIQRQVADDASRSLPANWSGGTVQIAPAVFEGDVSPRPDGNVAVNLNDWIQVGRYAAKLDYPTNGSEFQRADCAPRSSAGDGAITVTDWVQAGRYAAVLDPLTLAGGPTSERTLKTAVTADGSPRQVRVVDAMLLGNQTGVVSVTLEAQGDENALGFSLVFSTNYLSFQSASAAPGISGAQFNVNAQQASEGRLGFVLALPSGTRFAVGAREVVRVTFLADAKATGTSPVALADTPVFCEVSDPLAAPLEASYVGGTVTVLAPPTLSLVHEGQSLRVTWPKWATNFVLESFGGPLTSSAAWTNSQASVAVTQTNCTAVLPLETESKFYRLRGR